MDPHDVLAMADERFERRLAQESGAIRQEITALRAEVAAVRQEMATRQETAALRQEMIAGFAQVHEKIADVRTDVIKWSFLFWTGQFLTTAGFLLVILKSR
jgi:hypothetical protein